ncbi:hypothetical protein ATERTT37_002678 [Aspergillus terreus]
MKRMYENALKLLETRWRKARPKVRLPRDLLIGHEGMALGHRAFSQRLLDNRATSGYWHLLAFHTFIREEVEAVIFETRHGGEYDTTKAIPSPVVTGITSLGMDHVDQLGPTLTDIAWHKMGTFKRGFRRSRSPKIQVLWVMQKRAAAKGTAFQIVPPDSSLPKNNRVAEWYSKSLDPPPAQKSRVLIFSHYSEERDRVELVEHLARALVHHSARLNHVIFTTYDETEDGSKRIGMFIPSHPFTQPS